MERETGGGFPPTATPGSSYSTPPPVLPTQDAMPADAGPSKAPGPADDFFVQQWGKVEAFMERQEKKLLDLEQMILSLGRIVRQLLANEGLEEAVPVEEENEAQDNAEDVEMEEEDRDVEKEEDEVVEVEQRKEETVAAAVEKAKPAEPRTVKETVAPVLSRAAAEAAAEAKAADDFATSVLLEVAEQVQRDAKGMVGSSASSDADGLEDEDDDAVLAPDQGVVPPPPSELLPGRYKRLPRRLPVEPEVDKTEIPIPPPVPAIPADPPQVLAPASVPIPSTTPVRTGKKATVPEESDDEDNITLVDKQKTLRSRAKATAGRRPARTPVTRSAAEVATSGSKAVVSGIATTKRKKSPARRGKSSTPAKAKVSKRPRVSAKGQSSAPAVQSDLEMMLDQLARDEKAGVKYSDDEEDKEVTESDEPADEQYADSDASD